MKGCVLLVSGLLSVARFVQAAEGPFELTPQWIAKIESIAPVAPAVKPAHPRKALVFSLVTGYQHWVTPHTAEVVKILGRKSGAYEVVESTDVDIFMPENIKGFDIIILNNNCSDGRHRNLFLDATGDAERAEVLEKCLIAHIERGRGLVVLHGAIVMQNRSRAFSEMCGGSFDFHPAQQEVTCLPVGPAHPMTAVFGGEPFVHVDEPYLFNNAYTNKNFRPLLEMDIEKLDGGNQNNKVKADRRYVAWIKRHGEGRVFYCSPSHNAQSFERPELLRFMLDGIQYAAGDLACDDAPLKR